MKTVLIHAIIYLTFYVIGAYATTDILRLLKGCSVSVSAPHCYCPICHKRIALKDQLPVISYLKNHGCCSNCQSPIPIADLFMEVFLFLTLSGIATFLSFSWVAYFLCILWYEGVKLVFILFHGRRETLFVKNMLISLKNNVVLFILIAIMFLIAQLVSIAH